MACQTILAPFNARRTLEPYPTQDIAIPISTDLIKIFTSTPVINVSTVPPSSTSPTPFLSDTPNPSATLLVQTSTPGLTELPHNLQVEIFEELWTTINNEYLYPDFNGLDWNAIHLEYREHIDSGLTNDQFYFLMNEMINRLGDDHSRFVAPEEVEIEDAEYRGNSDYVGVGILVSAIPEHDQAVILVVFPDSPADKAGLKSRDRILAADSQPILDEFGAIRDIVRGPEGSQVTLTIQSPEEELRQVTITRQRITGSIPILSSKFETKDGLQIGYIQIVTFSDGTVDEQVREALIELTQDADLDGLILDNRLNNGGANTVMTPILSYFTSGTLGYFVNRDNEVPFKVEKSEDIQGSTSYPLVLLIGKDTVSYGEVFSGILKDSGRAFLIGETTEGNIETLWGYDFADGSRAWIAHDTFVPYNHPDEDWEQSGIIPDMIVEGNWYDYSLEKDPVIKAGIDYFDSH
jgi:C-terminal peptidase prc